MPRNGRPGREVALTPAIVAWRTAHGMITAGFLAAIAVIWRAALTGRRGRWLRPAIAAVAGEGLVVALNHGDCPLGPIGEHVGDPVPFFELLLSPRAARRAIPALGAFTSLGVVLVALRREPDALADGEQRGAVGQSQRDARGDAVRLMDDEACA